jgi:hypothetical protein
VPTFAPNSRTLDGGEPLVLRDGETREGVDVRVLRTQSFCMEGTIAGFGPRAYFSVGPRQPSSGTAGTTSSYHAIPGAVLPADGKIRVCDLPPGDYEVTVSESGAATFSAPVRFSTAAFSISDKDVTNVQIAAQAPVPLSGEVVWSGQPPDPPLEAKLRLFIQAVTRTNRASTASSLPGEFSFEGGVPVDDYKLDVNGVPDGVYVKDVAYGDRSVLLSTIRPGSGMAGAGVRVTLARDGGSVSVMVSDKDGNPVPECNVVLLPETAPSDAAAAAMLRTGKSDQRGRWSSGTVAPGKYVVLATTERIDRSPEAIAKVWKARVSGQTVEVKPGDKPTVKLAPRPL